MRARYLAKLKKKLWSISGRHNKTMPLFVAGLQRSGTTMLMNVFHLHPEIDVYDESHDSKVFKDFRVKNLQILDDTIKQSHFPFACYKVICDSHILNSFIESFPHAKIIWVYRDAADNAESRLRKFPQGTRAIRLVAQNKPGGGWFADGISPNVAKIVREVTSNDLTDFDFACLHWWARNSLFFELGLDRISNVRVLQYEELAQEPRTVMNKLFSWLDLQWSESAFRFVHAKSVAKPDLPELHPKIEVLCDELKERLDREYAKDWY
ncbi:MAG: sulfotransferase [Gammaproteobacteria bacterium]|nr:sulfotransferase [Gammaproteobacteria bacterium]